MNFFYDEIDNEDLNINAVDQEENDYIYGKLNKEVLKNDYTGTITNTAQTTVDQALNAISVDVIKVPNKLSIKEVENLFTTFDGSKEVIIDLTPYAKKVDVFSNVILENNILRFYNENNELIAEVELSSFVQEQSNLAETDPNNETFVRNKSTIYLANEGDPNPYITGDTSRYATQKYVELYGGKIDSISVNGTPQTIDNNKNVDLFVPTKTSEITNDGDGTSPFTTETYVELYGGKIDNFFVNGVRQPIADKVVSSTTYKKSVDIFVPTRTSEITNDSDFTTNTYVNNKLNESILQNTSITQVGDAVNLVNNYINLSSGTTSIDSQLITLADSTHAGMMSSADYSQIQSNTARIEQLEGTTTRLLYLTSDNLRSITIEEATYSPAFYINGEVYEITDSTTITKVTGTDIGTTYTITNNEATISGIVYQFAGLTVGDIITRAATASNINAFAIMLGYTVPFRGLAVVVDGTYHIWHYYPNEENGQVIGWKDDGQDLVNQFTNSTAGIIQGSATDGKVFAENDGTGSVYGWDALKTRVSNAESDIVEIVSVLPRAITLVEVGT